jgi:hypothetical protein
MKKYSGQKPPPKKEPLNLNEISLYIKDTKNGLITKEQKIEFLKRYKYIKCDYGFFYNIIVENDLNDNNIKEVRILNSMLSNISKLNNKKISKKGADIKIGQVLVDEIIKPQADKVRDEKLSIK